MGQIDKNFVKKEIMLRSIPKIIRFCKDHEVYLYFRLQINTLLLNYNAFNGAKKYLPKNISEFMSIDDIMEFYINYLTITKHEHFTAVSVRTYGDIKNNSQMITECAALLCELTLKSCGLFNDNKIDGVDMLSTIFAHKYKT